MYRLLEFPSGQSSRPNSPACSDHMHQIECQWTFTWKIILTPSSRIWELVWHWEIWLGWILVIVVICHFFTSFNPLFLEHMLKMHIAKFNSILHLMPLKLVFGCLLWDGDTSWPCELLSGWHYSWVTTTSENDTTTRTQAAMTRFVRLPTRADRDAVKSSSSLLELKA